MTKKKYILFISTLFLVNSNIVFAHERTDCELKNEVLLKKMENKLKNSKLDDNWNVIKINKNDKKWFEIHSDNKNDPILKYDLCISNKPIKIKNRILND